VKDRYAPAVFVRDLLAGLEEDVVAPLAAEAEALLEQPHLFGMAAAPLDVCRRWDAFCHSLTHAYQDLAFKDVEG